MSDSAASSELTFIIVGASVSGLASAISLKQAGHKVLILEKEPQLGGLGSVPNGSGCAELPPNGCKILLDWGLEALVKANSASILGFTAYKYEEGHANPDCLGANYWDPEILSDARGGCVQFSHRGLIRLLYDLALKPVEIQGVSAPQVTVLFDAEVTSIDCDAPSVTLRSGEVHMGHAIIGADGPSGVVRRLLMEEEYASPESELAAGIVAYSAIVPNNLVLEDDDLALFRNPPGCTVWFGANRALKTLPTGEAHDISLLLYTPDFDKPGTWTEQAEKKINDVLGDCDERVRKLVALTGPATCTQIKRPYKLQSWISESGKVVTVGDAAHPFSPGTGHSYAAALEDGTFIGKIFSHTTNPDRVPAFLQAFQEHREPRCSRLQQMEEEYIFHMTLPDGKLQQERDASMRTRHAAGQNLLDGDLQQMMEDYEMMYGYDASDDAEEWWMTWGRYHDHASASHELEASHRLSGFGNVVFSSIISQPEVAVDP